MVKVISIGMYNNDGKFISDNWYESLAWLQSNCDSLIVYCHMEYEKICVLFNHSCLIKRMDSPDMEMDVKSYKLYNFKKEFWDIIIDADFSIDINEDISHLYFMNEEQLLCMLEVTDNDNYMMIYYINDTINYSGIISNCSLNRYLCDSHKYDIDNMSDGEEWVPY